MNTSCLAIIQHEVAIRSITLKTLLHVNLGVDQAANNMVLEALVGRCIRNVASLALTTLQKAGEDPYTLNAKRVGSFSLGARNAGQEVLGRVEAVVASMKLDTLLRLVKIAVDAVGDGDSATAAEPFSVVAPLALRAEAVTLVKVVDVAIVGGRGEVLVALAEVVEGSLVAVDAAVALSVAEDAAFGAAVAVLLSGEWDEEQQGDREGDDALVDDG